mmetsp:Transcript_20542/g.28909  ORF Transcript_20542/g.28909 Transcript_20542/m.28909 type:complete len:85 (-) Transcript_20542:1144-1398(-)
MTSSVASHPTSNLLFKGKLAKDDTFLINNRNYSIPKTLQIKIFNIGIDGKKRNLAQTIVMNYWLQETAQIPRDQDLCSRSLHLW